MNFDFFLSFGRSTDDTPVLLGCCGLLLRRCALFLNFSLLTGYFLRKAWLACGVVGAVAVW